MVMLLNYEPDNRILLVKKIQSGKYQPLIQRAFVDSLIELVNNEEKNIAQEWLQLDWTATTRESLAANLLSIDLSPDDRVELLKCSLGFEEKLEAETTSTLGLLSNLGDTFYSYRQEKDKMTYHAKLLSDLMNIQKHISKTHGKKSEAGVFRRTLDILEKDIRRETEKIILLPELELKLLTRNIPLVEETTISYSIANKGSGPANTVTLSVNHSDGLAIPQIVREIGIISTNEIINDEIKVNPLRDGEFPIELNLKYTNLRNEVEEKVLSEVISIYSVSDFQEIVSPYISGLPIKTQDMFYGRQDNINEILSKLKGVYQDNVLILHGQRRTGKTSILYQLKEHYVKKPYIPVLVDMQQLKSAETRRLCRKIAEIIFDEISNRKIKCNIPRESYPQKFESDPIGTLGDFFDDLGRELPDYKILILFDEFEGLFRNIVERKVHEDFLEVMRGWMQHSKNVRFIITGADKLREMMKNYGSPLFQIADFIEIGFLKTNEAKDLIIRPVIDKLEYDDDAISKIVNVTASNPYYIQLICQKIVDRMNYAKRKKVTIIDVDKVISKYH